MLDKRRPVHFPRSLTMLVMVKAVKQRHIPKSNPCSKPNLNLTHVLNLPLDPNLTPKPNPGPYLKPGNNPKPIHIAFYTLIHRKNLQHLIEDQQHSSHTTSYQ